MILQFCRFWDVAICRVKYLLDKIKNKQKSNGRLKLLACIKLWYSTTIHSGPQICLTVNMFPKVTALGFFAHSTCIFTAFLTTVRTLQSGNGVCLKHGAGFLKVKTSVFSLANKIAGFLSLTC